MIADRLNDSGWRERLVACKTLPKLHGVINKDLCSKLLVCAWEDWSQAVRQAAAQALGQTAHGQVHVVIVAIIIMYYDSHTLYIADA